MARRGIEGSRALVTGASSGIGRELALELGKRGAKLVLIARREPRLAEVAAEVARRGGHAECVVGDVADAGVRRQALDRAATCYGGLDILVNNAGIGAQGHFAEADPARLRKIMEVNFFALVEMTRAALPVLKQGRRPMIVNIGSILGHRGIPGASEYCASKFAVQGFSESLRAELAPDRIDVLVVSPGTTQTEFFDVLVENRGQAAWSGRRGVGADVVARKIVRAICNGRHEIIPNWLGRLLCWLNRFSPRLADAVVARFG
jgi:short-subunit dehydrogenase